MEHEKTHAQLVTEVASLRARVNALEKLSERYSRQADSFGENAARYLAMIEAFEGLIYICSKDYTVEFMNGHFIARTGFDGTGGRCYKVIHGRDSVCPWCVNDRVFKGETVKWEILSPLDNRWYYVVNAPIYRTDGSVSKQAMILDIDNLKRAEEALKESEAKYRSLFDDSMDAICITDRAGRFIDLNRAAEELVGYSRDELLTKVGVAELFVDSAEMESFRHLVEGKGALKDFKARIRRKDGTVMMCLLSASVRRSEDGKVKGYQGVIRDVTKTLEAEEALVDAEKSTRLFAYSISHDLKNPAMAAYGIARRLKKYVEAFKDKKALEYASLILSASEQILRMADQVNEFITTKVTPVNPETTRMDELLGVLKEEFSGRLRALGVEMRYPTSLPCVWADRIALVRILRNLVENALKYGGNAMKEITLDCREGDDYCFLSVYDDGVPIPGEACKTIFEPFKRIGNVKGVSGVGLGLGIVRELAQRHGGNVWVESNETKGKTFFVSLKKLGSHSR